MRLPRLKEAEWIAPATHSEEGSWSPVSWPQAAELCSHLRYNPCLQSTRLVVPSERIPLVTRPSRSCEAARRGVLGRQRSHLESAAKPAPQVPVLRVLLSADLKGVLYFCTLEEAGECSQSAQSPTAHAFGGQDCQNPWETGVRAESESGGHTPTRVRQWAGCRGPFCSGVLSFTIV